MATFSITIPDDQVQTIADAFAMPDTVDDQGNPVTLSGQALIDAQTEFARQRCIVYMNSFVRQHLQWKRDRDAPEIPDDPLNLA